MPVIINDFEVIMEPQGNGSERSQAGEGSGGERPAGGSASLRPEDIERILRHYQERYGRLLAD